MSDEFDVVGDDTREARVVAVVLGEASAFEKEEVARLCEEYPELAVFHRRMESLHDLMGESSGRTQEVAAVESQGKQSAQWKLSEERRSKIMEKLGEKETMVKLSSKRKPVLPIFLKLAACLLIFGMVVSVLVPALMPVGEIGFFSRRRISVTEPDIVSYSASMEEATEALRIPSAQADRDRLAILDESSVRNVWSDNGDLDGDGFFYEFDERRVEEYKKPSAPSSAMAKVIAAQTTSPTAIPVPELDDLLPAADFGDRADFGGGWGNGGGVGGGWEGEALAETTPDNNERARRKGKATANRAAGDFIGSVDGVANFTRSFSKVPAGGSPALETGVVTAGKRSGDFEISQSDIDEVLKRSSEHEQRSNVETDYSEDRTNEVTGGLKSEFSLGVDGGVSVQGQLGESEEVRYRYSREGVVDSKDAARSDSFFDAVEPMAEEKGDKIKKEGEVSNGRRWLANVRGVVPDQEAWLFEESKEAEEEPSAAKSQGLSLAHPSKVVREERLGDLPVLARRLSSQSSEAAPPEALKPKPTLLKEDKFGLAKGLRGEEQSRSFSSKNAEKDSTREEAFGLLMDGREADANKDFKAPTEFYKGALDSLPAKSQNESAKQEIIAHLNGSVALAQQYRQTGQYDQAKELLNDVLFADPDNGEAQKALEYFADPIRTNPSLTHEHSVNVDEVRRLLYQGEGFYNLADYDKSDAKFHEVLRIDPYNKAARRWLVRNAAVKSDYYRAAYDQTRAELLKEVDAAWELSLPAGDQELGRIGELDMNTAKKERLLAAERGLELTQVAERVAQQGSYDRNGFFQDIAGLKDEVEAKGKALDAIVNVAGRPYFESSSLERDGKDTQGTVFTEDKNELAKLRYEEKDELVGFVTRSWSLSPGQYEAMMKSGGSDESDDFFGSEARVRSEEEVLLGNGVAFPAGSSVRYILEDGTLVVKNSVESLNLVESLLSHCKKQVEIAQEAEAMGEEDASLKADSTFSLHVSDVSFKLAKASLAKGQWPETVRVEEFVNAFSYGEQSLAQDERIGMAMEQSAHPFLKQRNLLRMSLQTAATGRGAGVPLRLTVVLDKSGSMERVDRALAVEEAFRVLVDQLNPGDKVTLVGFSRTPSLLADYVDGSEGERLLQILQETSSEGGTNVEEALKLARAKAKEHYEKGAQNRVVLLTDGIANLGESVPENLRELVEGMREEGVAFDACGVGVEGLNDEILEALTRKGDGRYYLLSDEEESGAEFARQMAGALRPAAQNVKLQIEWNPERVGKWRLYGFEKHELKKEDFRNDSVDAAELAAEEEGVALYHVEVKADGAGPLGVARVRFLDVAQGEMVEREWEIAYEGEADVFAKADAKVRLAGVAGLTAEKLARGAVGERVEWNELLAEVRQLKALFRREGRVADLEQMIEQAKGLE